MDEREEDKRRVLMDGLRSCSDKVFQLCEDYPKLKKRVMGGVPRVYKEACILKGELGRALQLMAKDDNDCGSDEPFRGFLKGLLVRCLNSVRSAQKLVALEDFCAEDTLFSHPHLVKLLNQLEAGRTSSEWSFVTRLAMSSSERGLLLEGVPILEVYYRLCKQVERWAAQILFRAWDYVGNVLRCLSHFAAIPPVKESKEEEEGEGGEEQQGDAKPSSGVGLGEGEGEKATTEGVESEDLFENPQQEEGDDEQQKEQKRDGEEEEDFVDYSDKLQEDRLTDQSENEEDDDEGGQDEEEQLSDMEGDTGEKDDDQHKKDDLLNSEDWKQQQDEGEKDKEEEKEENRQADFVSEEDGKKDNLDPANDAVEESVDDKERRERLPDTEETNDIEDQRDDGRHNQQEEPEVEDLDVDMDGEGDQCLDDLEGEDSDGDQEMEEEGEENTLR